MAIAGSSHSGLQPRLATVGQLLMAAALLGSFGCGGTADGASAPPATSASPAAEEAESAPEDAIAVRALPVKRAALSSVYSTSATLRADRRASVTSRTRGVIRELLVEEGDQVRADQPLALLEDDQQKIEQQRAATTRANTVRELDRAETLRAQELLSEEDYEQILRGAEEARHDADLADLLLSRTVIRAPFAGQVLKRHLDDGGNVADGTPVYDLADLDPLYADIGVPERQIPSLGVGQAVRMVADSTGGTVSGSIERLAPEVDPSTGTVKVTVAVPGSAGLRPGGFVRVQIVVDTHEQALVVPRSALVAEGRRWYVFRVVEDGESVERLEIERGFEEGDLVEVLAVLPPGEPLRQGDVVIVVGAAALTDGSVIRILDDESETGDPA